MKNKRKDHRGEGEVIGIVAVVFIGLAIMGGVQVIKNFLGGEQEGFVKYDDCRETITLKESDMERFFHKFTCTVRETASGKSMGGNCVSVKTENGICTQAYVYEKKQDAVCTDPKYPYLGNDDKCYVYQQ